MHGVVFAIHPTTMKVQFLFLFLILFGSSSARTLDLYEEIANAIVWLISDEASYVTSAILDVSGGR